MDATPGSSGSIGQTLGVLQSAMRELAAADYAELPAVTVGEVLLALERADAAGAVARGRALNAFDAKDGHDDDGQRTTGAWLVNIGGVTKDEARAHRSWGKLVAGHPLIAEAMGEDLNGVPVMSKSRARKVCSLTSRIPDPFRQEADQIIVAAARAGAQLRDLVRIAAEILARTAPADQDGKPFTDRQLRLQTTLDGAGVLSGDLSPECAAAVQAVLGELSKRSGPDDHRSQPERMHDALFDAMTRLLGSELAPKRNGHPVTAIVHIGLADMLVLDDGSVLMREWTARLAARWAGHAAAASEDGGDGGAWIPGPAARGLACDAALFPVVTGDPDMDALDELVRLCVDLDRCWHGTGVGDDSAAHEGAGDDSAAHEDAVRESAADPMTDPGGTADPDTADPGSTADLGSTVGSDSTADPDQSTAAPVPDRGAHAQRIEELMRQIIGQAAKLMSGEAGLASFLRRNLLGGIGLGGPSLPLDVGDVDTIPWWIRRAVTVRDQGCCRWPSGCGQPAAATQPHHIVHRADNGHTSLINLSSLCFYHHHIAVHRMGWTFKLHGDGTTEATSPDGRTFTSNSRPPPPRPG